MRWHLVCVFVRLHVAAVVESESKSVAVHSCESIGHVQLLDASDERDYECVCQRPQSTFHLMAACVWGGGGGWGVRLYNERRGGQTFDTLLCDPATVLSA